MVEPFAGILGTIAVGFAKSCLPYALSFAAGNLKYSSFFLSDMVNLIV